MTDGAPFQLNEGGGNGGAPPILRASSAIGVPLQANFYFLENDDGVVTSNITKDIATKFVGAAGEVLVQFDLLRRFIECHRVSAIYSYDIIASLKDRYVRIEVKTASKTRRRTGEIKDKYIYTIHTASNNRSKYNDHNVDIFAFVALDIKQIIYCKASDFNTNDFTKAILPDDFKHADATFNRCFG